MLYHFHRRAVATENTFTKSTMMLSREDEGELLEALVAELDVLVR
jgi:hypothetical protein